MWYGAALVSACRALLGLRPDACTRDFCSTTPNSSLPCPPRRIRSHSWIGPVRPVLMFSYLVNTRISLEDTSSYHLFNILIHALTGILVFLVIRRLLEWAGVDEIQPHSVRGLRRAAVSAAPAADRKRRLHLRPFRRALRTVRLRLLCRLSLPAHLRPFPGPAWPRWCSSSAPPCSPRNRPWCCPLSFCLTDLWWNPESPLRSVRANWKLYVVLAVGAAGGVALFWRLILGVGTGGSAGFAMKDFTWYQYLFTEFRAIFAYLFNFLLPVNLNVDWDFPDLAHHLRARRNLRPRRIAGAGRARLAVPPQLSPWPATATSSSWCCSLPPRASCRFKDPIADRRMYLPDARPDPDRHRPAPPAEGRTQGAGHVCGRPACGGNRWPRTPAPRCGATPSSSGRTPPANRRTRSAPTSSSPSPTSSRAATISPSPNFRRRPNRKPPTADLLLDWGLAYDGLNQPDKALEKFRQAAAIEPTAHVYTQIGYIYAKRSAVEGSHGSLRHRARSSTPTSPSPICTKDRCTWRPTRPRPPSPNSSTRWRSTSALAARASRGSPWPSSA